MKMFLTSAFLFAWLAWMVSEFSSAPGPSSAHLRNLQSTEVNMCETDARLSAWLASWAIPRLAGFLCFSWPSWLAQWKHIETASKTLRKKLSELQKRTGTHKKHFLLVYHTLLYTNQSQNDQTPPNAHFYGIKPWGPSGPWKNTKAKK